MLLWVMGGVSAVAAALAAIRHRRPLRRVGLSALCGCCALGLVNALSGWTGVSIALNGVTAFVSVVLGGPGIILLLVVRLFL